MGNWTHLIRFIAKEDQQVHLGQLVDPSRDVGIDSVDGVEIKAYLVRGSIFDGKVIQGVVYTVERVCFKTAIIATYLVSGLLMIQILDQRLMSIKNSFYPHSRPQNAITLGAWD